MLVQRTAFQVEAWQTGSTADSASYRMVVSRRGTYFWGTSNAVSVYDHNGRITYWAAPSKSSWKWDGSVYYLNNYDGSKQVLSWNYWAPQAGYVAANSLTYDRTVTGISRGNNRQGSRTINIGIQSTYSDSRFLTCRGDLTLTTSKIADVSNVSLSASADGKDVSDRYIRITASFTNPESYYTGYLYHGNSLLGSTAGSISKTVKITNAMFETTQGFTFVIKGKDGVTYSTKSASAYIEPSGVGIWYKQNSSAKECFHVYYKNSSGKIIEVTEAWAKRNNINVKTVK
jgi:hypothetical protein